MKTLETDRLILRPFKYMDCEDLYEYAKNPHVGPDAGWKPHDDMDETRAILRSFVEEDEVWAIVWKVNNKVIGSLGLHKDALRSADDVKMLGYVLSEDYWGKGIITEASRVALAYAFTDLDLTLVTVQHYAYNQKSRRVIEKCGFKYEGTLRHCTKIFNGNTYDLMCYSMTKDEWEKLYG